MKKVKTPLTQEEALECETLKAVFNDRAGMSQKAAAELWGLGTQSNLSHYLNKHQPLTLDAAIRFAKGLEIQIDAFSPRLARLARTMAASAETDTVSVQIPNLKGQSNRLTPPTHDSARRIRRAPIVKWGQTGVDVVSGEVVPVGELSIPVDFSNEAVVWKVEDDSMSPDYNPGDFIALDSDPEVVNSIQPGEAVIVETPSGSQMLRYYTPLADGHFEARPPSSSRYGSLSTLQMTLRVRAVVLAHLRVRQRRTAQAQP